MNSSLALPPELAALRELAFDVRWSWNHGADRLWNAVNSETWRKTGNALLVLQRSEERLRELAADRSFLREVQRQAEARRRYLERETWFAREDARHDIASIAYFSMEFGLSEALPLYAGGLGILAGDYLKTASDLGIPVVGVGLLYRQGYFQQRFDGHEDQEELYVVYDPAELPLRPVARGAHGALTVTVALAARTVRLTVWEAHVGRARLYLLDSDHPENAAGDRAITGRLYADDPAVRLEQEIVLGIGGMRVLDALGLEPDVLHLNEGHAAFAVLERARLFAARAGIPFEAALRCTRPGTVFTTHTAVAAAFDRFAPDAIAANLWSYAQEAEIPLEALSALGTPPGTEAQFEMPVLALRGAGAVNAVSPLHRRVSRSLFAPLFPRWPLDEIPIACVTNGVHMPSWDSISADSFWTTAGGAERWTAAWHTLEERLSGASDDALWELRRAQRQALSRRLGRFDPEALVLGFARRFTGYKRGELLLADPDRLARLLASAERPVQLVVAGKAHPSDADGKRTIHRWLEFVARSDVRGRAIFVPDYDLTTATTIIEGVDVWLNMPRRGWEACGTSGMKILVNGGLNCSTLDGWWDECYDPGVGWAVGGRDGADDAADAEALYRLLENEIVPEFYAREHGHPKRWLARIRASMGRLTPRCSTNRMMRDYLELYRPAARAYRARTANRGAAGLRLEGRLTALARGWERLAFGAVNVVAADGGVAASVELHLGGIAPEDVRVELYADPDREGALPERHRLEAEGAGTDESQSYAGVVATPRPATDYTPRAVPAIAEAFVPLECSPIRWSR